MKEQAKRILVLGSTGRVGRLLRLAWTRVPPAGVELILQSRTGDGVNWQPGQISPFGPVDTVIALWGVVHGTPQQLAQNTSLALAAQDLAAQTGAKRVLHCSSVAVYAPKDGLLGEADPTGPLNAYGTAKLAMERALKVAPGPARTILRIGSVAGAESLAASIREGWTGAQEKVRLDRFQDGLGPARSYVAPSDLAKALIVLATHPDPLPDVINLGAPAPVYMHDLLAAAGHPFVWQAAPANARQYAVMDCTRLAALTGMTTQAADPAHIIGDWLQLEGRA